jgi:hypothetical protein
MMMERSHKLTNVVYFINEKNDYNYFRIGYTTKDINDHMKYLQIGNRRKLCMYRYITCVEPSKLFNKLCIIFKHKEISNNWYKINKDEVNSCFFMYDNEFIDDVVANMI